MLTGWNPILFQSTGFTSSTFPIQPDFSQNQLAAITLNTGSPRKLVCIANGALPPEWTHPNAADIMSLLY